ncbi:MAG: UDP-N-acetylmuramate--L-alanine ligase [Pseudomonadota bacterium]|nr:UDP-N-acetylmuramate--L-alanine ligase [Pseudomonadota bacterium]
MKSMPKDIGKLHFCGIGGIGMSGIAEILHNLGYSIQGSDITENGNVERLRSLGISITAHQTEANIVDVAVLVISSAIKSDNPELSAARKRMIPVVRRGEMLAELMRLRSSISVAGTHGKTTTTSLISAILDRGGLDPTVINGGIINAYGTNARLGTGDWIVVEADESDGSFIQLPADIALLTNIDAEHLDHWGSFDELKQAFYSYIQNIPFYGLAVMCTDSQQVRTLIPKVSDRRIITYGFNSQADVRAINHRSVKGLNVFDVTFSDRYSESTSSIQNLTVPMAGKHNAQNALGAIAVAIEVGISEEDIREGLQNFSGVKRRFTVIGTIAGITVVDDYAHHPVEIASTLRAARSNAEGRVIAVFQPHRYSRIQDLFQDFCECFSNADTVIVSDIYAAGEVPIEGINRESLVNGLIASGHKTVISLSQASDLPAIVAENAESKDYVVFLGAGNVTEWAHLLPRQLSVHFGNPDGCLEERN